MKFSTIEQHKHIILAIILAAGLFVRIFFCFFYTESWFTTDSALLLFQAQNLSSGIVVNFFPNGYPLFILFFLKTIPNYVLEALVIANIIFSVAVVFFTYKVSLLVSRSVTLSLVVALVISFLPSQINYTHYILTEPACLFFVITGFFLLLKKHYLWAGLLIGTAAVIRTTTLPIAVFITLILLFSPHWQKGLLFLAVSLIPTLLLGFLTYHQMGTFAVNGTAHLNFLVATESYGPVLVTDFGDKYADVSNSKDALDVYLHSLSDDPAMFFKRRWSFFKEMWVMPSYGDFDQNRSRSLFYALLIAAKIPFFYLAAIAFFTSLRQRTYWLLAAPVLVLTGIHTLLFSDTRYTFVAEPFIVILACCFLMAQYKKWQKKRQLQESSSDHDDKNNEDKLVEASTPIV